LVLDSGTGIVTRRIADAPTQAPRNIAFLFTQRSEFFCSTCWANQQGIEVEFQFLFWDIRRGLRTASDDQLNPTILL
jgi:hypothetical protein